MWGPGGHNPKKRQKQNRKNENPNIRVTGKKDD
jgi:hypothetical protein